MKSKRIGLVDIDTSHPRSWVPILRSMGHQVVGVFDGGAVYDAGEVRDFARSFEIPVVYERLEQMADDVDIAIIHSCNWDLHVSRAEPFLQAGKAVLIDKPVVGNLKDSFDLLEWERKGARISGGSALRFAREVRAFKEKGREETGEVVFAFAGCAVDEFNYGIHAYSLLDGLMDGAAESVRHLGSDRQRNIEVRYKDGRRAIVRVGTADRWLPTYATLVTTSDVRHVCPDPSKLYEALLEEVLPYLCGEADSPLDLERLLQPERIAMAARLSWLRGDARIYLSDLSVDDPGYDGATFAWSYRLQRRA